MVAWEERIQASPLRQDCVAYSRLKRMLERLRKPDKNAEEEEEEGEQPVLVHSLSLLSQEDGYEMSISRFVYEVTKELERVSAWYEGALTKLEGRVQNAVTSIPRQEQGGGTGTTDAAGMESVHDVFLETVQLEEFATLNAEALRKILKKMDKNCGTKFQKQFVTDHIESSNLVSRRAVECKKQLEAVVSPEVLQTVQNRAMNNKSVGVGVTNIVMKPWRVLASLMIAVVSGVIAPFVMSGSGHDAQRCLALMALIISLWVSEAAPFHATAMLVPPVAVMIGVLDEMGSKHEQAKALIECVFNSGLYLVLCGFCISSVFSKCQLDCRASAFLQRHLGKQPALFMLAIMFLGLIMSALVSNVTAPLLLLEVLKPLLRDMPTDSRYSRALLLGLSFSCNVGGMATPISSPQNVASLQALRQIGGTVTWAEWLTVSVAFCPVAVFVAWAILMAIYHFDQSKSEAERDLAAAQAAGKRVVFKIPRVIFERRILSWGEVVALVGALLTLAVFAFEPASEYFGDNSMVSLLFIALSLGSGEITRQTFNAYSWHLLFLIGGGNALGLCVQQSGLLEIVTNLARRYLSTSPWLLVTELVIILVSATTFISHTVAALVFMPVVAELGKQADVANIAVFVGALGCSVACALPMTSFPNVNSLLATDDFQQPWLGVRHFLIAGIPMTICGAIVLVTYGHWLVSEVCS